MKKTAAKLFMFSMIIGLFFLVADGQKQTSQKVTTQDTLKIPAYRITIPVEAFHKMTDTSYLIMQDYGIEMSGSTIRANQEIMSRQWRNLYFKYAKPDTIRVVKGGKP